MIQKNKSFIIEVEVEPSNNRISPLSVRRNLLDIIKILPLLV